MSGARRVLPPATDILRGIAATFVAALVLGACGESEVRTELEILLQRGIPESTRVTEVEVRRGSCGSDAEVVTRFTPLDGDGMAVALPPGVYGIAVVARDADCVVQIDECVIVTLPVGDGRALVLRPSRADGDRACTSGEECDAYRCVPRSGPLDMGTRDLGTRDMGRPERDTGPERDLGPPPDVGPPPPDPCAPASTSGCRGCLGDMFCGWCADDDTCRTGDGEGPERGACAAWRTRFADCPPELDAGPPLDMGVRDTGVRDTGVRDTGVRDTGPLDSGPRDSGPPPCEDMLGLDCTQCTSVPGCGLCQSTGQCVPGTPAGPSSGTCTRWFGDTASCTPAALCPAGPCNVETQAGCAAGSGCQVDSTTLTLMCEVRGTATDGVRCEAHTDCAPGFACLVDEVDAVCRRYCCSNDAVCPAGQYCMPFFADARGELYGALFCDGPDACDPFANTGCGANACYAVVANDLTPWTECSTPGTVPVGAPCDSTFDCVPRAVCVDAPATCRALCRPPGPCPGAESCVPTASGQHVCVP